jgi:peptidoglycan/xylan/chitin deacetylase (PgdA/CDA1 family)
LYIKKRYLLYGAAGLVMLLALLGSWIQLTKVEEAPVVSPIYIGNTVDKAVALMVNVDWGEEIIPQMLQVFQENEIKATFFVTGRFAKKFHETVLLIAAEGHEIGNHGYAHPHPDKISIADNIKDITTTEQVFAEHNIPFAKLYAPPYGEHKAHVLEAADSLGYKTIMWTADTVDWQNPTPETIVKRIISKADNGALVLMHPKECTLQALPALITQLRQQDFAFKTVTEILQ